MSLSSLIRTIPQSSRLISQDLDTYLSQHPGLPQSRFGWAGRYKTYMNNYVQYRNQATTRLLPGLLTNIGADLNVANNNVAGKVQATWDQWNNLYNSMRTYYSAPGNGATQLAWEITWEWNTASVKRDEIDQIIKKRQACSQPITPSSIADPTATASSTSPPPETSSALSTVPGSGSGLASSASAVPSQATTTLTFTCTTVP